MAKRKRFRKKKPPTRQKQPQQAAAEELRPEISASPKWKRAHCLFLFALGVALYANTLNHGYVLDDSLFITGNKYTLQGLAGIPEIWANDAFVGAHGREFDLEGGRYRPLAITVFAIMFEFFGLEPFPGHLLNVLLFGLSCVVLYMLLLRLLPAQNEWLPLVSASLFAVHPVHTEVVANIKSLDELLSTLFLLLTLYFLFGKGKRGLLLSCCCYVLALLSKESSLTGLAIIPVTLFYFSPGKTVRQIALRSLPFAVIGVGYLLLRENFSGGFGKGFHAANLMDSPYLHLGTAGRLATITYVCGRYLLLLFWPHPLSWDYSYHQIPDIDWGSARALLSLLAYAGLVALAARSLKKKTALGYGILFYLFSFSIVSNYFLNIGTTMGERFAYLPSVGFCIALGAALVHLFGIKTQGPFRPRPLWLLPLILLVPLGGWATLQRNPAWKDNFTLYETDAPTVPNSARARMYFGVELTNKYRETQQRNFIDKAIAELQAAVAIYPEFYHAHEALGNAYQAAGNHQAAFKAFQRVLEIAPRHINSTFQLGVCYARAFNDLENAIAWMEKGISVGYNGPDKFTSLANACGMAGRFDKALKLYRQELAANPRNAQCLLNIGVTYSLMGDSARANEHFERAFALEPSLRQK